MRENFRGGMRRRVNGTPTFFINGMRYNGEVQIEPLLGALEGTT